MKRKFSLFVLLATLLVPLGLAATPAMAVNIFSECTNSGGTDCQDCSTGKLATSSVCQDVGSQKTGVANNPVIKVLKVVIEIIAVVVGIASIIVIIVSGLRMVLSAGDSQTVVNARNGVIYAMVGIAIAIFAQAIVVFVLDKI